MMGDCRMVLPRLILEDGWRRSFCSCCLPFFSLCHTWPWQLFFWATYAGVGQPMSSWDRWNQPSCSMRSILELKASSMALKLQCCSSSQWCCRPLENSKSWVPLYPLHSIQLQTIPMHSNCVFVLLWASYVWTAFIQLFCWPSPLWSGCAGALRWWMRFSILLTPAHTSSSLCWPSMTYSWTKP